MSDLGEIAIKQRPLIINEAIIGGRKVTKAVYMQLPELDEYPMPENDVQIVAWLNIHWKECGGQDWGSIISHEHRHIIGSKDNKPIRGTVFKPIPVDRIIMLNPGHRGGKELAALLARRKIEGADLSATYLSHQHHRFTVRHKNHSIRFEVYDNYSGLADTYSTEATRTHLVQLSLPQVKEEDLVGAVDLAVNDEIGWRNSLAQVWQQVIEETPQVLI